MPEEKTILAAKDVRISILRNKVVAKDTEIAHLKAELAAKDAEIARLQESVSREHHARCTRCREWCNRVYAIGDEYVCVPCMSLKEYRERYD